ncbi:MAG: hypothetical protein KTR25_05980 [Myxococcales bacterium]|nr:hypothetical protein [Myxococcales bacterium]
MKNLGISLILVGFLVPLRTVSAQEAAEGTTKVAEEPTAVVEGTTERTVYKQKTVIDFSGVTIEGELTKPEGSYVLSRKPTKFRSLLKARADFIPELKASLDTLL